MLKWLEYIPFICIATLVRALPRSMALNLGSLLGQFAQRIQSRRVSIARDNLQKAFPEMSAEVISTTINDMFKHLGISFIDMLRVDKYNGQEDLDRYFEIENEENLKEALSLGRGCIILTGHLGFWEAGAFLLPQLGFETDVVAKPMRNPLVDAYFSRQRKANGNQIINSRKGARGILRSLKQNRAVCVLLDQHLKGTGSIVAPFFGRPAHTTTIVTQMAIRHRIPIVAAYSYRQPDNTYRCHVEKMILLEGELDEENILASTTLLNQQLETAIRKEISQWFWLHRRWRHCCERQSL